jgi:hypothetical protein
LIHWSFDSCQHVCPKLTLFLYVNNCCRTQALGEFGNTINTFTNPANVGENGLWPVNLTQPLFTGTADVFKMEVCLPGSGAITSLEYTFCAEPTTAPVPVPTPAPNPTTCNIVQCDFSTLDVGVPLTDSAQAAALKKDCLLNVTITDTFRNNVGNVFNSSNVLGNQDIYDPDLGSPNRACNVTGPGKGKGGRPDALFPNCEAQGNLLIIQNEDIDPSIPNDSRYGGCFFFQFVQPVTLLNFGIMDVDESDAATITITPKSGGPVDPIDSPPGIGDNGHWKAASTVNLTDYGEIVAMEVCLPGSGAISFIDVDPCNIIQ